MLTFEQKHISATDGWFRSVREIQPQGTMNVLSALETLRVNGVGCWGPSRRKIKEYDSRSDLIKKLRQFCSN